MNHVNPRKNVLKDNLYNRQKQELNYASSNSSSIDSDSSENDKNIFQTIEPSENEESGEEGIFSPVRKKKRTQIFTFHSESKEVDTKKQDARRFFPFKKINETIVISDSDDDDNADVGIICN